MVFLDFGWFSLISDGLGSLFERILDQFGWIFIGFSINSVAFLDIIQASIHHNPPNQQNNKPTNHNPTNRQAMFLKPWPDGMRVNDYIRQLKKARVCMRAIESYTRLDGNRKLLQVAEP